jgi:hypothetical protein
MSDKSNICGSSVITQLEPLLQEPRAAAYPTPEILPRTGGNTATAEPTDGSGASKALTKTRSRRIFPTRSALRGKPDPTVPTVVVGASNATRVLPRANSLPSLLSGLSGTRPGGETKTSGDPTAAPAGLPVKSAKGKAPGSTRGTAKAKPQATAHPTPDPTLQETSAADTLAKKKKLAPADSQSLGPPVPIKTGVLQGLKALFSCAQGGLPFHACLRDILVLESRKVGLG